MSLLLDALKKAAEQKAEKARAEGEPAVAPEESVLTLGPDDTTVNRADAEVELSVSEILTGDETDLSVSEVLTGDETDLSVSEVLTGDETDLSVSEVLTEDETDLDLAEDSRRHTQVKETSSGIDETGLDIDQAVEHRYVTLSQQMETGEDESIVIAADDIFEFMGDPHLINRRSRDGTDLGRDSADDANLAQEPKGDTKPDGESKHDTDLLPANDQVDAPLAEAADSALPIGDETDLSQVEVDENEGGLETTPGEDTDLSHVEIPADAAPGVFEMSLEPIESQTDGAEADDTEAEDDPNLLLPEEDLSLLLRDEPDVVADNVTAITEQKTDNSGLLRRDASYTLSLVDVAEEKSLARDDLPATSAPTNAGLAPDTLTNEGITTRAEPTSTRTYAPDNYDRTLMKLPGEDASRLFAGMKSDADVVMTPEYAKKVFQSKSATHRLQYVRIYAGIIIVIVLGIGVYGIYEIDHEAGNIEANLRQLKQDPMPGVIKQPEEESQDLFENISVDEDTIKLVESAVPAASGDSQSQEEAVAAAEIEPEATAAAKSSDEFDELVENGNVVISGIIAGEAEVSTPQQAQIQVVSTTQKTPEPASKPPAAQPDAPEANGPDDRSTLQVSSSSRLGEQHQLLREAYTAYQAGDDRLALQKYNRVLEIVPGNRNALLARAAIKVQNSNAGAAIADYRQLLLANPKDSLAMTSLIAVANVSPVDAETQLKLLIRDEPDSPYLNFALANAYGAQDRWREAQGHYFTALENNPGDPNYAYNLAVSLEHIAKPEVAVSYYRRALDNMKNGLAIFSKEVVDQRLEILGKL